MSLRLVAIDPDTGVGYELTDRTSGLRYSNVRPGGDESASFTFHAPWRGANPEVDKRNVIVIYGGLDVLWQGRIEDVGRGEADGQEALDVTAYGLGVLLKSTTEAEIFIDRELDRWQPMPAQRVLSWRAPGDNRPQSISASARDGGLEFETTTLYDAGGTWDVGELWYASPTVALGYLGFDFDAVSGIGAADPFWLTGALSTDDLAASVSATLLDTDGSDAAGQMLTVGAAQHYLFCIVAYSGAYAGDANVLAQFREVRVIGRHGLTFSGASPNEGLIVSQIIAWLLGRMEGITLRIMDATTFILQQAAYHEPKTIEELIADLHRFHLDERTWGTWGPDSPLAPLGQGYFDYTAVDQRADWIVLRERADALQLDSQLAELFNVIEVSYTDVGDGETHLVTRTRPVPELGTEERVRSINAGTTVQAAAETYGDALLAAFGGFAPAAGSITLSAPVPRADGRVFGPEYLRADGSTLRVPDVLESPQLFELSGDPDRRSTFPVKRVDVQASGERISASVELDQGSDALDQLDARRENNLALAAV